MNKTKWQELSCALSRIGENGPVCSYKHVGEIEVYGPSHISWSEFSAQPTERYEWLEIRSHEQIHRGQLVSPQRIDHSPGIESALKEIHVPFIRTAHGFKVWGYVSPSHQPDDA